MTKTERGVARALRAWVRKRRGHVHIPVRSPVPVPLRDYKGEDYGFVMIEEVLLPPASEARCRLKPRFRDAFRAWFRRRLEALR